jgi:hypothetical protein
MPLVLCARALSRFACFSVPGFIAHIAFDSPFRDFAPTIPFCTTRTFATVDFSARSLADTLASSRGSSGASTEWTEHQIRPEPATKRQRHDTPELLSAGFGRIIPRANNGIGRKMASEPSIKLPAGLGASTLETNGHVGIRSLCRLLKDEGSAFELRDLAQQAEYPAARRVGNRAIRAVQMEKCRTTQVGSRMQ